MSRTARIERATKESKVLVELDLDGTGRNDVSTGVGFYDHMLSSFSRHSLVDLTVQTEGDTHIDAHHTVEDTAIALGDALREALGDKSGIRRFGDSLVPLDEALVQCAVDVSGRPYCVHTGEPEAQAFVTDRGCLPRVADPARLRDARLPRPGRPARPGDLRPRPAPPGRGAVQGRGARPARRRRVRPARDRGPQHQGLSLSGVVVFDYGSGNTRSVVRALERAGADVTLTADRAAAMDCDGLVVPGVGAFRACVEGLRAAKGHEIIGRRLAGGRPVLGICVGMQVLFEHGVEHGVDTPGLDEWTGVVERLQAPVVPHMGWNTVEAAEGSTLFAGIEGERFYFVHSYGVREWTLRTNNRTKAPLVTWATHGGDRFVAAVENGPLCATQFHPEKSGDAGARLLRTWVASLS